MVVRGFRAGSYLGGFIKECPGDRLWGWRLLCLKPWFIGIASGVSYIYSLKTLRTTLMTHIRFQVS